MNKNIKAQWIAALRSGEYKQAKGSLRTDHGYCCLGVLCALHVKATGREWLKVTCGWPYYGVEGTLPDTVCRWAGLECEREGRVQTVNDPACAGYCLSSYNDDGVAFDEIAELIERNLH